MKPKIQKDMKIGLIDVDGHAQKKKWGATIYPNLALCKIASYHRSKGDTVEWYNGILGGEYDLVYMAKVFSFSTDYLENLWHNAGEEPRCNELLLGEDTDGFSIYRWCGQEDNWEAFVNETGLIRFAYIDDLLPKGGKK